MSMSLTAIGLQQSFTAADLAPLLPDALRRLIEGPTLAARDALTAKTVDPWDLLDSAVDYAAAAEQIIAEQSARIAELEALALTDPLTGLMNRRGFEEALRAALDLSRRHGEPGVLIYLDLDGFKEINDRYGHAVGDRVLQHVADSLRDAVRASDVVARLGGDEFAVLLHRAAPQEGADRAAALQQDLNASVCQAADAPLRIGVSLGVDAFAGEDAVEGVMRRADLSMYRDKRARRGPRA
jgi:diguanylate cyclase (GGDEF)-like protein